MNRRHFLKTTSYAGLTAAAVAALPRWARAEGPRKPNLLFVFADQHRAASTGCYGDTQIQTPKFDAFAKQGMRMDAAISNSPVCVPYRASLMTGMNCPHLGVVGNASVKNFKPDLEKTLGRVFKRAGYKCGYIGKTHMIVKPAQMGFEDYWAYNYCEHAYYTWTYQTGPKNPKTVKGTGFYRPQMEADLALEFMRQEKDNPFCLFLSWGPPHDPYLSPPAYDHYKDLKARPNVPGGKVDKHQHHYYGMIEGLDVEFGRLIAELDKLKIADNTIVVYTSDHGDMMGSKNMMKKRRPYCESMEVPFLIRYPKHIAADSSSIAILSVHDVFPTLASLAGLEVPGGLDGMDLSPVLLGKNGAKIPEYAYITLTEGEAAASQYPSWRGVRTARHTYARKAEGPWVLFDHQEDPYELKNLVAENPKLLKELDDLTQQLMKKHNDPFVEAGATT